MFQGIQKNFLFVWVMVLLTIAIVLSLTFSACSSSEVSLEEESAGKATSVLLGDCSDSDGQDTTVRGKVTVGGISYADKCVSPFLVEYYCEDGNIANKVVRCECERGACI